MSQDDRKHRIRFVFSQLKALADNLPVIAMEHNVDRYNGYVDELVALGFQAEGFRIDYDRDMFRPVANTNSKTGKTVYRDHYQVHHGEFDRQVKALLTYFELAQNNTQVNVTLPRREG